jgi:hypothetical protein
MEGRRMLRISFVFSWYLATNGLGSGPARKSGSGNASKNAKEVKQAIYVCEKTNPEDTGRLHK